ncbi:hypothetical protein F2Q68_00027343 [Brassica cretica]|uniref:Tetratricopeptide repeat protein 1 n=1 Tax=Brassica cretica TaxID=69181 RepID=A0A8S9IDK9_BRACR|nr:hypothetical protein F2Q68_00027343 [Brassica cretica]
MLNLLLQLDRRSITIVESFAKTSNSKQSRLTELKMVLIESESDDEISVTEVPIPSRSSSSPPKTTEAKIVGGDDSEGFETASEREVSDNEEEEEEGDRKEDAIENQEPQPSDNPEKKEDQVEAVADVGSNQKEKALEDANEVKMEGNKLFGNGLYEDALSKYELALQFAQEFPESVDLRSICHSNRAICYLKLGKYAEAIKECTKAIELNPSYTKALRILELDPSNDQARKGIRRLEPLAAEKREKMKEEAIAKLKEMGNTILGKFGMSVDNFKAVKDPNTGSYSFSFQN